MRARGVPGGQKVWGESGRGLCTPGNGNVRDSEPRPHALQSGPSPASVTVGLIPKAWRSTADARSIGVRTSTVSQSGLCFVFGLRDGGRGIGGGV